MIVFGISKRELRIFLERSLREKERSLFIESYMLQGNTFSSVVKLLNKKYPESTTKTILQRLKRFNLIEFGDMESKGRPLIFTKLGIMFFKILRGDEHKR